MRSFFRRALVVGVCAGATVLGSGCERKEATEYVTGVSTQVSVPRDLKAIRLQVSTAGVTQFCRAYRVYDGKVLLPRSLGTFSQTATANSVANPITYSILGIAEDTEGSGNEVFTSDCTVGTVGTNNVRVLRRSTQPYILNEILLLPMPLKYSCFDVKCGDTETCKGGTCVPDTTDPKTLQKYNGDIQEGDGSDCFSTGLCMGAAIPAIMTDAATCTFVLPETKDATDLQPQPPLPDRDNPFRKACTTSGACTTIADCNCPNGVPAQPEDPTKARQCNTATGVCDFLPANAPPWTGLNVEVSYDSAFTKEILDIDKDEGFTIPDPTRPHQFRLAPGLCAMMKGVDDKGKPTAHRITGVRASGTCASKKISQPICTSDALKIMGATDNAGNAPGTAGTCNVGPLLPPRAALMVVVDNTVGHKDFFSEKQINSVSIPLSDPALARTDVGLLFAGRTNKCGGGPDVGVPPAPASNDQSTKIKAALNANNPTGTDPVAVSFESALINAYQAVRNVDVPAGARRGVLVVGNREFNADACNAADGITPASLANAALTDGMPVRTYSLQVTGDDVDGVGRAAVGVAGHQIVKDDDKLAAVTAFQTIVSDLATCTYDWDPAKFDDGAQLYYGNGLTGKSSDPINRDLACTAQKAIDENAVGGWNYVDPADKTKGVVLCDKACKAYRDTLLNTAKFAAAYQQSPIAAPMYARSSGCAEKK